VTPSPRLPRLALLVALACLARPGAADLVVLRNGQELRGRVRSKGDEVRIELDVGGTVVIAKGDVARMEIDQAARAAEPGDAAVSAVLLERLEAREQVHTLIDALDGGKEAERRAAEHKLAAIGRAALPMLRQALAGGKAAERLHALRAIAAIGDPASLPAIRAILAEPKDQPLHVAAAEALADIAGHAAAPVLAERLANAKDSALRLACLKKLAASREPFAVPFLVEALREPELRATTGAALSRWLDPVALPFLLPLLSSGAARSRELGATWAAGLVTPAHAVTLATLLDAYKDDKAVRGALRGGVRRLHNDFPVVGDIELLGASQATVRAAAFESLRRQFPEIVTNRNEDNAKQPRFWQVQRANATRAKLLVVPVGSTTWLRARELGREIERSLQPLKIPVDCDRQPAPAADGDGRRELAALALRQLAEPQAVRVIGVTAGAVRMPGYGRALAPTWPGGPVLVSLAGLGEDKDEALRRARRLALHALARSFGLPPAKDPTCPTTAVYEPRDLDAKAPAYCAEARGLLAPLWDAERLAAAFDYRGAARALARLGRDRKSAALRTQAAYMYERALDLTPAANEWKALQQEAKPPAVAALIGRRVQLLARAEKWLATKSPNPPPRNPRQPRRGGR